MTAAATFALSELRSLITKAARGAGLGWGLAEEAGWAAEWLARRGMPAADWATVWLAASMDGAISPLEVGAALADEFAGTHLLKGKAVPDGLVAPGYLLPFLHRIAQVSSPVSITSSLGLVVRISASGDVELGSSWQLQSLGWRLSTTSDAGIRPIPTGRPAISRSVLECLDGLALRTTVPRSDSSRKDAGSIGGDND